MIETGELGASAKQARIMARDRDKSGSGGADATIDPVDRRARLAAELRVNLQRRKTQARSRRQGAADARPDGLSTGEHKKD
jgi:hypothetical protein